MKNETIMKNTFATLSLALQFAGVSENNIKPASDGANLLFNGVDANSNVVCKIYKTYNYSSKMLYGVTFKLQD